MVLHGQCFGRLLDEGGAGLPGEPCGAGVAQRPSLVARSLKLRLFWGWLSLRAFRGTSIYVSILSYALSSAEFIQIRLQPDFSMPTLFYAVPHVI